jgi:S1-C subfamily serine protease
VQYGELAVTSVDDLHALLTDERIGRRETVVLLRDGVTRTIQVEPGKQPSR